MGLRGAGLLLCLCALAPVACMGGSRVTPDVRLDPVEARPPGAGPLASVAFMAGCWRGTSSDGRTVIDERWTPPEAGMMLGTTRYFRDGRAVDFEFSALRATPEGPALLPHPKGRASEDLFVLRAAGRGWASFEAPQHEYPKRIRYERSRSGLTVTVDGGSDDPSPRRWRLQAGSCTAASGG